VLAIGFVSALALSTPLALQAKAMPDAWITTKVKLALLTGEDVSASDVNVDTVSGRVTLHGTVDSAEEKANAERIARSIEGTRDVRNLLQVVKPSMQEDVKVSDADLKSRVSDALAADPALKSSSIKVASVNAGVVLLAGSAKTLSDHLRAVELASRVRGVRRVASEVESPDMLGDAEIWRDGGYDSMASARSTARDMWTTSEAKMRLLASDKTPGFDINVDTTDGVVTLFGMVDSQAAKDAATAEVQKVGGAKKVVNELQVVAPSRQEAVTATDDAIDEAVDAKLEANPRLADANVDVEVKNGVARLTGTVKSQSDRLTALTLARSTGGVRGLVDDIQLETSTN
jgi:hyperosmotically inducible protein